MDINATPHNIENYMAFMLGKHLVFLDSFQFILETSMNCNREKQNTKYVSPPTNEAHWDKACCIFFSQVDI